MGVPSRPRPDGEEVARCSICGQEHPVATMVTRHRDPEEIPPGAPGASAVPGGWWLEDAEALNAAHPRSFFIPRAERRRALRAGEPVRLGFAYGPHADREGEGHVERMWVEVVDQRVDGQARGRLRNRPARFTGAAIGDLVAFGPEHVLGIDVSDEELGYAQGEWAVVDRAALEHDRAPDVVVRAPGPDGDGEVWWLLCMEDAGGPATEGVGLLTDRFPGLEEPLRTGAGVWELAGGTGGDARWRRVPDDVVASTERWRRLLAWLGETARAMRP